MKKLFFSFYLLISLFSSNLTAQQAGTLDTSFGQNGLVLTDNGINSYDQGNKILVQADGKILIAGTANVSTNSSFTVVYRYNPDGILDPDFAEAGIFMCALGSTVNSGNDILLQNDGKILILGQVSNPFTNEDIALIRLNTDGSFDPSFGTDGKVVIDTDSLYNFAAAFDLQADGKIVIGGAMGTDASQGEKLCVLRCNQDGTLDNTFGINGIISTITSVYGADASDLVLQNDGKIVLTGATYTSNASDFVTLRYDANGSLDSTFSADGIDIIAISSDYDGGNALVIQNDHKIVVLGIVFSFPTSQVVLLRYDTNGLLDSTFSGDGKLSFSIGTGLTIATGIALQSDGKILVGGYSENTNDADLTLVRINTNGMSDISFGTNGKVMTDVKGGYDYGNSIDIQADGKIVLAGSAYNGAKTDIVMARYYSGLNVGINDFSITNVSALLYPNPVIESATLSYQLEHSSLISIELVDIQGKIVQVFDTNTMQSAGKNTETLYFSKELAKGVYFLKLYTAEGQANIKIIKG